MNKIYMSNVQHLTDDIIKLKMKNEIIKLKMKEVPQTNLDNTIIPTKLTKIDTAFYVAICVAQGLLIIGVSVLLYLSVNGSL